MGPAVKILDLAKKIMKLESHSSFKSVQNKTEIVFTGLRSGEKLHEELMISKKFHKTDINKLHKVQEPFINAKSLKKFMEVLEKFLEERNEFKLIKHLKSVVEK